MAQKIRLPDGTFFPVKEGETPEQALDVAARFYPEAFTPKAPEAGPKSGGIAALKAGVSSLKSDVATLLGRTGAISEADAEKYIEEQKKYQARTFKPTETFGEAPLTKFAELLGGSVPYMAAPLAAGAAAVYAPVVAGGAALTGAAATIAGAAAAGSASAAQFTGSFLSRQMETGKKLGETNLGTATLAALPAAALDTISLRMIPGIRNILGAAGREVTEAEAKVIAQQNLGRTLGDYVATSGKVAGVEGLTESAQQVLERLQAGLNIADEEARKEYFDSFVGGAVLGGTLAVPGRFVERGKIKGKAEAAEEKERADARAAAAQAQQIEREKEELRKQDPEYMRQAVAQSAALEKQKSDLLAQIHKAPKGERLTEEQKQENIVINAQLKELAPKLTEAAKESNRVKPLLARMDEEARLAGMSPEEFMLEQTMRAPGMQVPRGGRFATVPEAEEVAPPEPSAVEQYVEEQTEAAKQAGALTLEDRIDYLMANPIMADQIVKTRTPMPDLPKKDAKVIYDVLTLRLKEVEKQRQAIARAATGAAAERVGAVEAEEQAALEESQRQQAELDAEAERQRRLAPEQLALRRMAERPAVGVAGLINRLPIEGEPQPLGSSVMGRTAQELRGLPIGAEGEPIYTAEEEKAPAPAAPRRVKGEFRLFNQRGEPQRPSDYNNIQQRIARALARDDIDQDAYNLLRRAEEVLPVYDQKIETVRESYTPEGGVPVANRKDVTETEGFLTLLDQQLERIEKGEEGILAPGARRPVTLQAFPAKGARAEAAAPTMADLRDIQKNASADPQTLTELQRRRAKAYNKYIQEGKSPAQAAGYAYRDSVIEQPEGERVAAEAGEVPVTKRGSGVTARTLRGPSRAAVPLSLSQELEPLLRLAEQAAGPDLTETRQIPLFEEEQAKLGMVFQTPEEFAAFLRSDEANRMRGALSLANKMNEQLAQLPQLEIRAAVLSERLDRLFKLRTEIRSLKELTKNRNTVEMAGRQWEKLSESITDFVVDRMELAGKIEVLTAHKERLEDLLKSSKLPAMRVKGKVAPAVAATEKLKQELSAVLKDLETAQATLGKMSATAKRAETMLRVLRAENRLSELYLEGGEGAALQVLPDAVIESARQELAAAVAELEPVQKKAAEQRIAAQAEAGAQRRRETAVKAAQAEKARTEARKEEQRRLEERFAADADKQEITAITEAQRDAREMAAPTFNIVELNGLEKDPVQVLGGYRSAITALEAQVRKAQEKSKQARMRELDKLKASVEKFEQDYRAAKTADERAALIPQIEAATAEYADKAEKLNAQPLTWKGMASQIKQLSSLYNKVDFLEAKIGPNGEFAASVLADKDQFRALLTKEARAEKARLAREKKAAEKKAAAKAEAKEAASRAGAPATTGEALTRTEAAEARKQKKTVFGTATGSAAEATAQKAADIQSKAIVARTVNEVKAKQAKGEALTDDEKKILAQAEAADKKAAEQQAATEAANKAPAEPPVITKTFEKDGGQRTVVTRGGKVTQDVSRYVYTGIVDGEQQDFIVERNNLTGETEAYNAVDLRAVGSGLGIKELVKSGVSPDEAIMRVVPDIEMVTLSPAQEVVAGTVVGPEGAKVLKEQTATLTPEETATLEEEYGAKKNSKKFLARLNDDIVDMVTNGGKAVAKAIRAIVKKMAEGVLAAGMIFNPQFTATHLSFDLPQTYRATIEQQVEIKDVVPVEARAQMSPLAQTVYENMAPVAKASGKGFGIVDKVNGTSHFFMPDGKLLVQGPTLTGASIGDVEMGNSLTGGAKITPAGKFTLGLEKDPSYKGGYRFDLKETFRAGEGVIAIHAVYVGDPKENRLGRLASPDAAYKRISYGCINTTDDLFVNKLLPNANILDGGMLLVLPDATEKTVAMFPAQVQTVTKTVEGTRQTARVDVRKIVGREEKVEAAAPPSTVAMEYTTATRTESNPAVREAIQDGRLMEALDRLAVEGANDLIRQVAKELSPLVMRTKVRMDPNLTVDGVAVPAAFGVDTNTISFRPTEISDEDIIHEATHAATMRVLRAPEADLTPRQLAAKRELQAIFANLKEKRTDIAREYGLKDVEEFVSEVQSNVEFRAAINKQPWYRRMWDAIVRLFSKAPAETVSERASRLVRDIYLPSKKIESVGAPAVASVFRSTKPRYESENDLTKLADRVIAQPESFVERNKTNLALKAEMNAVDMRAGLQEALKRGAKEMGDDKLFTQAMYNVRKADQFMPMVYTALTNGPHEFYTDDKGLRGIKSSNQNNAQEIFAAVKNVPGKNTEAKFALASTYMIAQRAANKGLSKLDLGELGLTEADLAAAMAAVDADPALKSALEEVRRRYNAFNEGQIKFLADAGVISKAEAKAWLKDGDYVPYYRVREDGTAELVFGGEKTLTLGDIRTQPYLAELKGGETKILPLNESIIRNTMLLTKAALYNNATKEVAYAMQEFGAGKGPEGKNSMPIHKGQGPAGPDIIRFKQEPDPRDPKDDGKRWLRINTKNTAMEGIPSELVVKSLEGAHLTLPAFLKIGGIAGDWLRKGVTRMPPYIFRQLIRDPMAASFTGGLNYGPFRAVVMAGTEFLRSSAGRSEAAKKLIEKGLIQSGVFTGDPDDMSTFATQLASGKDGPAIDRLFGMLDRAAMRADAATRKLVYENALKNGLSEVEADMMTMESMNFYKRGLSPTVQYANRLIPFMNAQIQGLNVLAKAMRGNMPFEERQRIQRKFWNNGLMLFGVGLVYAMAMDDDETFNNAKPRDKYTNFFVHLPGVSEAVKVPLPYESGWFFTLAVALADAMKAEVRGEDQLKALKDIFLSSVPGYSSKFMPQAIKPLLEVYTNKNFFSGQNIESVSMQNRSPEERFNASTTEAAKALGKVLPLSPVQIEHLARGYFGTAPLAMMSAASSFMREEGVKGEAPERRLSETPILGTVFQKQYGGADVDTMYSFAKEATQRAASLKEIQKTDPAAAREYLASHRTEIALAPMARQFETVMGRLRTQENLIRNRKDLSAEEKRARLDQLDKARQDVADRFNAAVRRAEAARAS